MIFSDESSLDINFIIFIKNTLFAFSAYFFVPRMKFVEPIQIEKINKAFDDLILQLMHDNENLLYKEYLETLEESVLEILAEVKARKVEKK